MNQKEFMQLINPFKDKVFRIAKRLLVSTEEAEDATQEVLVKLWNKNESLEQYNSVEALAMTMTKNYCLDQLKSKRAGNLKIVHNNFTDREAGFAVVRILGNDMNPNNIMNMLSLIKNANVDMEQLKPLQGFIK